MLSNRLRVNCWLNILHVNLWLLSNQFESRVKIRKTGLDCLLTSKICDCNRTIYLLLSLKSSTLNNFVYDSATFFSQVDTHRDKLGQVYVHMMYFRTSWILSVWYRGISTVNFHILFFRINVICDFWNRFLWW